MVTVQPYTPSLQTAWDACVTRSKNGIFLFHRGFMEYHSHRFDDASLVFLDQQQHIIGLLPAHRHSNHLISHGGLTYGGLILADSVTTEQTLQLYTRLRDYLRDHHLAGIRFKPTPHFLHNSPCDAQRFAWAQSGAVLRNAQLSTIVHLPSWVPPPHRRRGAQSAQRQGLHCATSQDFDVFFALVNDNLQQRYGQQAVHTPPEMALLSQRFPQNIELRLVLDSQSEPLGGALIFQDERMVHTQYITSTPHGRKLRCLDLLLFDVINRAKAKELTWLSFGASSHQAEGNTLVNHSLLKFKEEFGGQPVTLEEWEILK